MIFLTPKDAPYPLVSQFMVKYYGYCFLILKVLTLSSSGLSFFSKYSGKTLPRKDFVTHYLMWLGPN